MSYNVSKKIKIYDSLILILVVFIIIAVAYPIYRNHVIAMKRSEAKLALYNLAGAMERHYSKYNTYESATIATNPATDIRANNLTIGSWYKLEIAYQTNYDYIIKAIPLKEQAYDDTKCGVLSITKFGEKRITGKGPLSKCWN